MTKLEATKENLDELFKHIDNLIACNAKKLLLDNEETMTFNDIKSYIFEELKQRLDTGKIYRRISTDYRVSNDRLGYLFNDIDKTLVSHSDELLLNTDEKNALYVLKVFIDGELKQRLKTGKVNRRLNAELKGE